MISTFSDAVQVYEAAHLATTTIPTNPVILPAITHTNQTNTSTNTFPIHKTAYFNGSNDTATLSTPPPPTFTPLVSCSQQHQPYHFEVDFRPSSLTHSTITHSTTQTSISPHINSLPTAPYSYLFSCLPISMSYILHQVNCADQLRDANARLKPKSLFDSFKDMLFSSPASNYNLSLINSPSLGNYIHNQPFKLVSKTNLLNRVPSSAHFNSSRTIYNYLPLYFPNEDPDHFISPHLWFILDDTSPTSTLSADADVNNDVYAHSVDGSIATSPKTAHVSARTTTTPITAVEIKKYSTYIDQNRSSQFDLFTHHVHRHTCVHLRPSDNDDNNDDGETGAGTDAIQFESQQLAIMNTFFSSLRPLPDNDPSNRQYSTRDIDAYYPSRNHTFYYVVIQHEAQIRPTLVEFTKMAIAMRMDKYNFENHSSNSL